MLRAGAVLLAASAGVASALAHPPVGAWPLVFLPPLLLLLALDRAAAAGGGVAGAVGLGWVAGFAGFAPLLSWIIPPAGILGWLLLSAVQALFTAVLALALWPLVAGPARWRAWVALVVPIVWTGVEVWRTEVPFGGFGWGNPMYAHVDGSWMLPMARILGGHGLTLFTVAIGALLFDAYRRVRPVPDGSGEDRLSARLEEGLPRAQRSFVVLAGVLLASVALTVEPPPTTGETLEVLAVQGNDLEDAAPGGVLEDQLIADAMLELTAAAVAADGIPELTVWPESSIDRDPFEDVGADLLPVVQQAADLVDGGLTIGARLVGPRAGTFLNATVLVDASGAPVERYIKRHPVPFGEYVPFRPVLGDFPALRQVPQDAIRGEKFQQLTVAGVRIAPVICFETLFPDLVRNNVLGTEGELAGVIVMSTNDASYERSAESAQHLAQSRLRAVENGRWVVHAALSGASAFIDPDGDVHQRTELFERTTIRRELPVVEGATPYLAVGDVVGPVTRWASLAWLVVSMLLLLRRRRARRRAAGDGGASR